jgi:hypothetical protein
MICAFGACRTVHRSETVPASLLGDPKLTAGVEHRQAFAGVEIDRPQMLQDLFGRVPSPGHGHNLPGCGPV